MMEMTKPDLGKIGQNTPHIGIKSYVLVWGLLLFLTAVTVLTANLNLGGLTVIVSLTIAAVKSTLVLLFFMHLLGEKRLLIRLLIPIAIVTLAIFIGLTYSDLITR
jgi:cytochrome c oxidase subunit IV